MRTMKTVKVSEIRISDAHLAAYLLARGYQVTGIDGSGTAARKEFLFREVPTDVIASYYGGEDSVSARALLDALRNLRGLLAQGLS
jgi:nucleoside-diphosphate-sugar epimerase